MGIGLKFISNNRLCSGFVRCWQHQCTVPSRRNKTYLGNRFFAVAFASVLPLASNALTVNL